MALKLTLMALASLPLAQSETVLGVYIFHRHGDRTPKSYPPANLTSLGAEEVLLSGTYYRNRYIASDASSPIAGLSHDIAVQSQVSVTVPDDAVLHNSAQVFVQGLYPPVGRLSAQELANGTSVEAPLGGYQYVPVKAASSSSGSSSTRADAENNEWLQGGSGCGNAMVSSNNYFASSEYQKTYSDSKAFYQSLLPVISGTFDAAEANFKNGYTIFDLINVARIHNKTIPSSDLLTPETVAEVQNLANIHEWNLAYNETEPIRAIAGSVLAGQILQQLQSTLDSKSKSPLDIQFGAYASFSSFFGLAQLQKLSADFTGIVDYASSMAFELVTNSTSSPVSKDDVSVRFLFSNGTAGAVGNVPVAYPLFGRSEILLPWSVFADEMNKFAIGDTKSWCTACGNSTGQCAQYASSGDNGSATAASKSGNGISTAVAGVIGALVTLVVILGIEGLVYVLAGLRLVKKSSLAAQATKVEVPGASKA
ncbi:histidine acid phosphatase [Apiospora phragmitis]|uniref:Histidine acid phosphatase n=1 Tax=Apiospora phragmitis TaxID=2905665 RepID=A0ABR1TR41_9PEZI